MSAQVFLLCGLPGSGKTTFAGGLEQRGAVRFSPDEWTLKLYGAHMTRELFDTRLQICKDLILSLTETLLKAGVSVTLDFGLWTRKERSRLKTWAQERSLSYTFYYFDVPLETLWTRLEARNRNLPEGTFEIDREMLELFAGWFEPPEEAEGLEIVRIT